MSSAAETIGPFSISGVIMSKIAVGVDFGCSRGVLNFKSVRGDLLSGDRFQTFFETCLKYEIACSESNGCGPRGEQKRQSLRLSALRHRHACREEERHPCSLR